MITLSIVVTFVLVTLVTGNRNFLATEVNTLSSVVATLASTAFSLATASTML